MGREVTVATLIYRSPEWLNFVLDQLGRAKNDCRINFMIVGNDANTKTVECAKKIDDSVIFCEAADLTVTYVDHRNADPYAYYMARIYHAWNRAMREAPTEDVILINSDMSFADHWADELLAMRDEFPCVPTSLLIESGRVPSGLPTYVRDFGRHWSTFDRAGFLARAEQIREGTGRRFAGGLFMPCLFRKSEFFAAGGYEIQERDHVLASDAKLFQKFENEFKLQHVTAVKSVVYHCQKGEMEDDIA
jgi:hypothetical protein